MQIKAFKKLWEIWFVKSFQQGFQASCKRQTTLFPSLQLKVFSRRENISN